MPPQIRGFAGGPGVGGPFHQAGFPTHTQPQGGPLSNQYMGGANAQMNPFSNVNGNSFNAAAAAGLNAVPAGFADSGFGSQSARMGFAHPPVSAMQPPHHGGPHQQHALQEHHHIRPNQNRGRIREVWRSNLKEEMAVLRELVDKYPYIAMDTEFPGVVSRPMGSFRGKSDYHYQCLRTNVDMLNVIQIGITLFNEEGDTPPARAPQSEADVGVPGRRNGNQATLPCSWQFNFKFSLTEDMYSEKSIESLRHAGIDFESLQKDGIDPFEFAALLIPSGLVCFKNVKWISFHGGYDFGYLTKLLICTPLPNDEVDFDRKMKLYFPTTYDVKHLMKHAIKLQTMGQLTPLDGGVAEILQKFEHKSGLENIADAFKIKRVGNAHQAGSDSLLTGKVFFQMRERIYHGDIPDEHVGKVWGLGIPDSSFIVASMLNNQNNNGTGGHDRDGGAPSTPQTGTVGLATTPGTHNTNSNHNTNGLSHMGPMTPGGGGGVFGSFAISGNNR